jgi:hypothetical protein
MALLPLFFFFVFVCVLGVGGGRGWLVPYHDPRLNRIRPMVGVAARLIERLTVLITRLTNNPSHRSIDYANKSNTCGPQIPHPAHRPRARDGWIGTRPPRNIG